MIRWDEMFESLCSTSTTLHDVKSMVKSMYHNYPSGYRNTLNRKVTEKICMCKFSLSRKQESFTILPTLIDQRKLNGEEQKEKRDRDTRN